MSTDLLELESEVRVGPTEVNLFNLYPERASILVVDDENGPRQALRMLLKEHHDVFLASDVTAAQQIVERECVDLIITDIRIPRQSGIELLQQVRKCYPDIEVIILTGYGHLESAMKAVEYGAFAYLEKPFDNATMLKHVEAALQKRRRELVRRRLEDLALEANRFETLGRVVSGMIHDLGTPLSVVGSHVELLLLDPGKADLENRLKIIRAQVGHCTDIVRSTMNFLRHQAQQSTPINLNEIAEACLEVGHPLLRRQNVSVAKCYAEGLPYCVGDFVLVRQAILNLLTNACQAMDKQEQPREITVRTWSENQSVCFSIADNGPGIPRTDRTKVFDAFYSTKGKAGTGLGLAVVKNVMQRHGGEVCLGENRGCGALFVLKFPIQQNGNS
ncbi:MAG: response regulator [Candidatus Hydrogenedentes bacterium]|nr:response regulator [Candidatus Hydrogenedentota bacterium]